MPWVRVDDSFHDHPKLDRLGSVRLACIGLNMLALSWSSHWLTDGFIPAERVRKLGGTLPLADRLVEAGLWEREGDDYRIHHFLDYNPSREEVRQHRETMRRLGKRGGLASGEARRLNRDASTVVPTLTLEPRPVPSRPYPSRPLEATKSRFDEGVERTQRLLKEMRGEG